MALEVGVQGREGGQRVQGDCLVKLQVTTYTEEMVQALSG